MLPETVEISVDAGMASLLIATEPEMELTSTLSKNPDMVVAPETLLTSTLEFSAAFTILIAPDTLPRSAL